MYSAVKGIVDDYKTEKKIHVRKFSEALVEKVIEPRAIGAGYRKLDMSDKSQEKTSRFYVPPLIDFEADFLSKNYGLSQESLFMMFRYKNAIDTLNEQLKEHATLNFSVWPDFNILALDKVSAMVFNPNDQILYSDKLEFLAEFKQDEKSWDEEGEFVQKAIDELEKFKF